MRIECPGPNTKELSYLETQQKRIIQQIPRKTETLGGYDVKKSKKRKHFKKEAVKIMLTERTGKTKPEM